MILDTRGRVLVGPLVCLLGGLVVLSGCGLRPGLPRDEGDYDGGDEDIVGGQGGGGGGGAGGGGGCVSNFQCDVVTQECVGGSCVPKGSLGTTCVNDDGCDSGYCCDDATNCEVGKCSPPIVVGSDDVIPGCESDADCGPESYCHYADAAAPEGTCALDCVEQEDCDAGQLCHGGRCYTLAVCATGADCPPDEVCEPLSLRCTYAPDLVPDWCRLQSPVQIDASSSELFNVVGRLREPGMTDGSPAHDLDGRVRAQAGFGPFASDPANLVGWTWFGGSAELTWNDAAACALDPDDCGADEFKATVIAPSGIGDYALAFRFSLNAGAQWTYCDIDTGVVGEDGIENGYQVENAGLLSIVGNPCAPNPCTSPSPASCDADGVTRLTYSSPGTCTASQGLASCNYPVSELDCSITGATCDAGACVGGAGAPTLAGELFVTELMPRSQAGTDLGEWLELYNPTTGGFNLEGCVLRDDDTDAHIIGDSLYIAAHGHALLAKSADAFANHGLPTPDYVFSSFALSNSEDEIEIACGGTVIDRVAYTSEWVYEGIALQLDADSYGHVTNNDLANYCPASPTVPYGPLALRGTPGVQNTECPLPNTSVDTCRTVGASPVTVVEGSNLRIVGQVFEAFLTDQTSGIDANPSLLAQVGTGDPAIDPSLDPSAWTWQQALPTPGWIDSAPGNSGWDQYESTVSAPPAGDYRVVVRFSLDNGASWLACDRDGTDPLFDLLLSSELTTFVDPCAPGACPAIARCEADGVTSTTAPPGVCTLDGINASCAYDYDNFDCSLLGGTCIGAGECDGAFVTPLPGDVVLTEVMWQPPPPLDPARAQWIELFNPSVDEQLLLRCELAGQNGSHSLGGVVMAPGAYAFVAREATNNGGLTPDDTFAFALASSEALSLSCDGALIDAIDYDEGVLYPAAHGVALGVAPGSEDEASNDDPAEWCLSRAPTPVGSHVGTPGLANPACKSAVERCALDWPADLIDVPMGDAVEVLVLLEDLGLSDLSPLTDAHPAVELQVGFGPDGALPEDPGWTWVPSLADASWTAPASPDPDAALDRYTGEFVAPAPGSYDVAARVTLDGGRSYAYCDANGGSYDAANAGALVTIPGSGPNLFFSEYVEGTLNNKAVEIYNAGGSAQDLSDCSLFMYFNGSASPQSSIALSVFTLAPNAVRTVCHVALAGSASCGQTSNSLQFNGNDAVALVCGGDTLDVFGRIGQDPGAAGWGTSPVTTVDRTLRRKCSVVVGDRVGSDTFLPATEYDNAGSDVFSGLGSRGCP